MQRNTITCDRYQLLCSSAADRRSLPLRRDGRVSSRTPRSCLYYRFYSECNSCIIDRRHCEIHKPSAALRRSCFIASPLPLVVTLLLGTLRPRDLTFCDRRLTPRFDATDDIHPRSGLASDKSSQMFYFSFFHPFFRF